jgi:hypothetical protein
MSMNSERENFEDLRRLLALKRHEQPPPGFFNEFPRRVITRIRSGEDLVADSFMERLISQAPWMQRLWNGFEAKPILAGAFGLGVCGLLVVGLVSSERIESNSTTFSPSAETPQTILANVPNQTVGSLFERARADHVIAGLAPSAQSQPSIFDEVRKPRVQPVNFSAPSQGN